MPAYIGTTTEDPKLDKYSEMNWGLRTSDQMFGVLTWPSLGSIYEKNHNQLVGKTWTRHLEEFAKFVFRHKVGDVLEIGSGHGLLSREVKNLDAAKFLWHTIEPNPLAPNLFGRQIVGWFPSDLERDLTFETVIHSHVLEHTPSPWDFVSNLAQNLHLGGRVIMSWPNMEEMARNLDLNILMFEHLTYLPVKEVTNIFELQGFKIIELAYFEAHSVFAAFEKVTEVSKTFESSVSKKEFQLLCRTYEEYLNREVVRFNDFFGKSNLPNYWFGAHIFLQYFIAKGLHQELLQGVLDNNPDKTGQRLYGTELEVRLPDKSNFTAPIAVGMAMASYEREIVDQLLTILPKGSKIFGSKLGFFDVK